MAAFHQMTYDVFIGRRGHISMSDVLAKLVNEEEGFDFMPDQGNEITAKIIDWFLVNRAGQACSIDELRPGHALYLHGQILSWSEQVRSYTIGNVRISEWSFKENDEGTGYDIFVRTDALHFHLMAPVDPYLPYGHVFQLKMATMFYVQGLVIGGVYGFQEPRGDPSEEAFTAYTNARVEALVKITQYWDFIRVRLPFHLLPEYPRFEDSPFWMFLFRQFIMAEDES